jgi:SAM-dependent methyltransferase
MCSILEHIGDSINPRMQIAATGARNNAGPAPERVRESLAVPQNIFTGPVAVAYDLASPEMNDPALLDTTAAFLATEADGGRALELGIGTGRIALPLSKRSVEVHGIDISADMIDQLRHKPGAEAIATTVGDFADTVVPGEFSLVYVVYNSITNLLEQDEWVACFVNAARHLGAGGRFVMELMVPDLRRFPPGATAIPFEVGPDHVGVDTIDVVAQRGVSHHFFAVGDRFERFESPFRYAWPAELDLMARIAGLTLVDRWADWDRSPFTAESTKHISVWERPR